jgi:nitrogen fixation protein NifU and related proteins
MTRSFDMNAGGLTSSGGGMSSSTLTAASQPIPNPDGRGWCESECGDLIEIFVRLDAGIVTESGFHIQGCAFTVVCGRVAAALIRGKTISEARRATRPENIEAALGGLPEPNRHCAELAANAVGEALIDAASHMSEPWKKPYRLY